MKQKGLRKFAFLFGVLAALLASSEGAGAMAASPGEKIPEADLWQITLLYRGGEMRVVNVAEIAPLAKRVSAPGLVGAPCVIDYALDWLDVEKALMASTEIEVPVGKRVACAAGASCAVNIPEEGVIVVRTTGPAHGSAPAALHMKRLAEHYSPTKEVALPSTLLATELELPIDCIERKSTVLPLAGPFAVKKVNDTGPDTNRPVMAVVGDGYTSVQLLNYAFTYDTARLTGAFMGTAPWRTCMDATNFYRIDVESNESGADFEDGQYGTLRDTYFNASFWTNGIERLLALDAEGELRAVEAADTYIGPGVWDYLIVIVHSDKYGGSGGGMTVISCSTDSGFVVTHEMGHTFAGLADEYTDPWPGFPSDDHEPNVDFDCTFDAVKWNAWILPTTPLPTPNTITYCGLAGAFEGARYQATGIYRPYLYCKMRDCMHSFCPVCEEAQIVEFLDRVNLADSVSPTPGTARRVSPEGLTVTASPLPLSFVTCTWRLDGVTLAGKTDSTVTIYPADLLTISDHHTLELAISCSTNLVRKTLPSQTYTWTLDNLSAPVSCDVNTDGVADALDVQLVINAALGLTAGFDCDINGDGSVDAVDVQLTINAALGLG